MKLAGSLTVLGTVLAAALTPQPAHATTMISREFTCPIGGEKFEDFVIGSYSTFGQRPDGRSYRTLPIYPIVECPGNGFLLFQEKFSEKEIAVLEPLVASAEYQAMRTSETPNYRVWWLMRKLGRDPLQLVSALLRASWETDDNPARKARYQATFIDAATALTRNELNAASWFWYNLRAVNALRELGRFHEAALLLARIDRPEKLPSDPEQLEGARFLIGGLRDLIGEGNRESEPTNLIPPVNAAERCSEPAATLSLSERTACAKPEYREAVAEFAEFSARSAAREGQTEPTAAEEALADAEANLEAAAEVVERAAEEAAAAVESARAE